MVGQARKDEVFGSQDLATLIYFSVGFFGSFGSIFGGIVTEYSEPRWVWFGYSFFGLIIMFMGSCLSKDCEGEEERDNPEGAGLIVNFRKNCADITKALQMREIYQLVLFYILRATV